MKLFQSGKHKISCFEKSLTQHLAVKRAFLQSNHSRKIRCTSKKKKSSAAELFLLKKKSFIQTQNKSCFSEGFLMLTMHYFLTQ